MSRIRIGSRDSRLAVVQSQMVMEALRKKDAALETELVTMKTTGDKILDRTLDKVGGKGLFVKELDRALVDGRVDLCVHSLKDMPMEISEELPIFGYFRREDPRDVLVLPENEKTLDPKKPIGTSSPRRVVQLRKLFPEAEIRPVRGNLQTRLQKLDSGEFGGLVLAAAGLKRLGLERRISRCFSVEEMIPAAGQGILAIQGKKNMDFAIVELITDPDAKTAALCERAFVTELGGGCSSPIAAYAKVADGRVFLRGLYVSEQTGELFTGVLEGAADAAGQIGRKLARELLRKGEEIR